MKFHALTLFMAVCLTKNVTAISRDWQSKIEINQQQQINAIIDNALKQIQEEANAKGTPAAQACYETAKLSLKSISEDSHSQVLSCVSSATTAAEANICSQQVASNTYGQGRKNATADWKSDVKINHWQQINTIINNALARIQTEVNAKGTPAAQACYETARLSLRSISQNGYNQVSSCVSSASTAGDANVCAQQVDSSVFNQGLDVSRDATACINKA